MDAQQQRGKYKYVDATSGFNGQRGWGYQTCTEVFQPMPTNGVTDMLLPSTPNKTALFESCEEEVKKTRPFLRHSTVIMIILPRQARYKHRESSRKSHTCVFFLQWGTVPRPEWEEHQFGGPNVGDSSNIFLSAGKKKTHVCRLFAPFMY